MQVILLEKVKNLGGLGDKVSVKPGYGRNYLIPQGKALPATPKNVADFEARRAELERQQTEILVAAQARGTHIDNLEPLVVARKVGMENKLFGSVSATDIIEAAKVININLKRHEIRLPDGPLRLVGDYSIAVQLHAEVTAHLKVQIVPEA